MDTDDAVRLINLKKKIQKMIEEYYKLRNAAQLVQEEIANQPRSTGQFDEKEFLKNQSVAELLNRALGGMIKNVSLEQKSVEGLLLIGGMFEEISKMQKEDLLSLI